MVWPSPTPATFNTQWDHKRICLITTVGIAWREEVLMRSWVLECNHSPNWESMRIYVKHNWNCDRAHCRQNVIYVQDNWGYIIFIIYMIYITYIIYKKYIILYKIYIIYIIYLTYIIYINNIIYIICSIDWWWGRREARWETDRVH